MAVFKFLVFLSVFVFGSCSLFDPHQFPASGPFVEGWYIRITDPTSTESYAVMFGKVLPKTPNSATNLAYIGILRSKGQSPLQQVDAFPNPRNVLIFKQGQTSYSDPDVTSTPDFEWKAETYGSITVNATHCIVDVSIEGVTLKAVIGVDDPWSGNTHLGPEHWLVKLPLPLHWFVYSLASKTKYTFTNGTDETIQGTGTAHMEKNWGKSFPNAWFWSQGHKEANDVTLALSGGWLRITPLRIPVRGHYAGYRNHAKRISLDFRPDNSVMSLDVTACQGLLRATFRSLSHKMEVSIIAPPNTFSQCLYGPMENGFRKVCSESYRANMDIRLYRKRHYILGKYIFVDRQRIENSALEFGGTYMCQICRA